MNRYTYSFEVSSKDAAYEWLMEWYAAQPCMDKTHTMTLSTTVRDDVTQRFVGGFAESSVAVDDQQGKHGGKILLVLYKGEERN